MIKKIVLPLITLISFCSCAQTDQSNSISVIDLKQKLESDTSFVLLDVRTPEELMGPLGKIDNAINIPIQELGSRLDELEKYKGKEIDVICRTGRRSAAGTDLLRKNGFNAKNVLGGMVEYRKTK